MNQFKNNRAVLAAFAVLMVIGVMAAYIPLLFPQNSAPQENPSLVLDETVATTTSSYAAQLPKTAVVIPTSTRNTSSSKNSLPDSFSGLQDEQQSLDDLNNLLK